MIIYGGLKAADCYGLRWSRVLRPLLLVNVTEGRQVESRLYFHHRCFFKSICAVVELSA